MPYIVKQWINYLCPWFFILFLFGCASPDRKPQLNFKEDDLISNPTEIINKVPVQDRILWDYKIASLALQKRRYDIAKKCLDEAISQLLNIYGPDPRAKRARSLFGKESEKLFIGEPYERAMAWYYRGLLYWMDGELDNARACFKTAQLMDSYAEGQEYKADFVMFDYLDGFITEKLGSDGKYLIRRAQQNARLAIPPDIDPGANVFFFIEYGKGPLKYATGEYNEQLRFKSGYSRAKEVKVYIGNHIIHVGPYDDLYFQATTRGGRPIDYILKNKAVFKEVTDTAGTGAMIAGTALAINRDTREIGLGLVAAGLISKLIAFAVHPQADIRCWEELPLYLSFAFVKLVPGEYEAKIEFLSSTRAPIPELDKHVKFTVKEGHDTVIFVSDKSK